MISKIKVKHIILSELILLIIFSSVLIKQNIDKDTAIYASMYDAEKDYIKWVNFDISSKALEQAYKYDVASQSEEVKINWIEVLAYLGHKYGGDFSRYKEKDMVALVDKLKKKEETIKTLTEGMKYYDYYYDAYSAVLGGMVGNYKIEVADETAPGGKRWEEKYGLKVFLPFAKYYPYSHFDDFGVSRSYGFKRKHLGHDMMGQVGTPIVAVESGYVEALGWNQYGGWRIGIRSFDKKRYYYYAHLRKNFPYNKSLELGSIVQAGDVIGYLGRTGYSSSENANNIQTPHLHFGMQLIFDESQKESNNEIWIDCYDLIQFLFRNRSETVKDVETKEYHRVYQYLDPIAEHYINHSIYKYEDEEFEIHIYE
ncbi:MAG: putative rane protein [Herbinix sp.]|jgi:murein DD-endopeptidase MepM/ murein hydrolase activator NlpD|nr:putative rane protein [Herbinix sp.]